MNALVNAEFAIGDVRVRGVELCHPCVILGAALSSETVTVPAAVKWWVGRGGLRVDVLNDGEIVRGALVDVVA